LHNSEPGIVPRNALDRHGNEDVGQDLQSCHGDPHDRPEFAVPLTEHAAGDKVHHIAVSEDDAKYGNHQIDEKKIQENGLGRWAGAGL